MADVIYLTGIRFWLVIVAVSLALFLANLEIPIVTTSLVAITNDFGGFEDVSWIIGSYLLGYAGFIVIFAKLSDIYGRKLILATSMSVFLVFSAACGGSQTLNQLIILRAFQGIGGAGCFAIGTAMCADLVPPEKRAKLVANIGIVYAISLCAGPIMGGAISGSGKSSWRWVFLLNVPAMVPALAITLFALPTGFPHHDRLSTSRPSLSTFLARSKAAKSRIDILGTTLLLLATVSLAAGFEEAGKRFSWRSAYVISLLTISGILWIALLIWEWYTSQKDTTIEPVLPWRFFKNRAMVSLLLNAVFLGGPWSVAIFQLPQKYQTIYDSSGLKAGIQTIPFTIAAPLGTILSSILVGQKFRVPVIYVTLFAAVLQTTGFALLSSLPADPTRIPAREYGYQVIAGFGCGINISTLLLAAPFVVEFRDKAVSMGCVTQLRMLGAAITLAIATSVFNGYTKPRLAAYMVESNMPIVPISSPESLVQFSPEEQVHLRAILAQGYNKQMIVLCAFAAAQIPTTTLLWRKKQITL
ncbi:MFS general substrate transporter [Lophiostoma macrostomum CBS 122681]|uniref:MFS general substrate transporter n=1 Tax=Lophiostoma macrostomum CBS 122681 TaxID=1314788 RepID=A0A6A6SRA9_9PLEO|nr:MFS general substrate transporter [Lophiostoma macrostomum CBS 122681]